MANKDTAEGHATVGASGGKGGGGGIKTITSNDGSVTIVHPTGPTTDLSVVTSGGASWPTGVANRRFFALDPVNGNDANAGFSDVSSAAAGAVAKKTEAGLAGIFPKVGNGRVFEVIVLGGGQSYSAALMQIFDGAVGYDGASILRATATNATAGSIAFAGDLADVQFAGFKTATGMNATGYNPTGATGTTLTLTKVGGGAPAFPAEPALPQGYRTRFDSATTTAAIRNKCLQNWKVTSGAIKFSDNTADNITTVNTDVCYVEMPGATVPGYTLGKGCAGFVLIGIGSTGAVDPEGFTGQFSFIGCTGLTSKPTNCALWCDRIWADHPAGQIDIGMGFRDEGTLEIGGCGAHIFACSTKLDLIITGQTSEDAGTTIGRQYFYRGGGAGATWKHEHQCIGNGGANQGLGPSTRMIGATGIELDSCYVTVDGLTCDGAGGIVLSGTGDLTFGSLGFSGTCRSHAALSTQYGQQWRINVFDTAVLTATGTVNDIELVAMTNSTHAAYAPWTTLNNTVFGMLRDTAGNTFIGGAPQAQHSFAANNNGEMLGPLVPLINNTGSDIPQWSLITEDAGLAIFLPKADSFANAAGRPFVMITPAKNGDWALCAKLCLRAPMIFQGTAPTQGKIVYMSTNTFGAVTIDIPPMAGTNQKFRIGLSTNNSDGTVTTSVDFTPELFPTTADGLK